MCNSRYAVRSIFISGTFSLLVPVSTSKLPEAYIQCTPVDETERSKAHSTQIDGVGHEVCEADDVKSPKENEPSEFHAKSTACNPEVNETPLKTPCNAAASKSQWLPSQTPFEERFSRSQGYDCSQPFDYDLSQKCDSSQNSEGRQVGSLRFARQNSEQEAPARAGRGTSLNPRSSSLDHGGYSDATLKLRGHKQPSIPTCNLNLEEEKEPTRENFGGPQHRILSDRSIPGAGGKAKVDHDGVLLPDKESRKISGSRLLRPSTNADVPPSDEMEDSSLGLFQDKAFDRSAAEDANGSSFDLANEAVGSLFQTGRGRRIHVSDESLSKVEGLFQEKENRPVTEVPVSGPTIFQTSRGKEVHVSEDSIRKAAKFLEHQEAEPGAISTNAGRSAFSGPRPKESKGLVGRPLVPVKVVNQNIRSGRAQISSTTIGVAGHAVNFGSGHDGQEEVQMKVGTAAGSFREASTLDLGTKDRQSSGVEELKNSDPFFPDRDDTMTRETKERQDDRLLVSDANHSTGFEGFFRTGKGQSVKITAESMEKVAHLFQEPATSVVPPATISSDHFRASSISATRQNQHQQASANISSEPSKVIGPSMSKPSVMSAVPMFQTGRGRNVQVSEESVKKVAHLFIDDKSVGAKDSGERPGTDTAAKNMPAVSMFQTGRGKSVIVSEESLRKAESLFNVEGQGLNGAEEGTSCPLAGK